MTLEKLKEILTDNGMEDTVLFSDPDYSSAFEGVTSSGIAVYNYRKMVEYLMVNDNMSYEDAVEFIDYNTLGAYVGDNTPIVYYPMGEIK